MRSATLWMIVGCVLSLNTRAFARENDADQRPTRTATAPVALPGPARLVEQLGADSFSEREKAASELMKAGLATHGALLEGLKHRDAHVRRQSRWLLERVLDLDFRRRLKLFEDGDRTADDSFLGWHRFSGLVGGDADARWGYAQMLAVEGPLLEMLDAGGGAAIDALQERISQLQSLQLAARAVRGESVATVLFAVTDPAIRRQLSDTYVTQAAALVQQPEFSRLLADEKGAAYRRLAGKWLLSPAPLIVVRQRIAFASQQRLPETLALVRTLLDQKNEARIVDAFTLKALGLAGGKDGLRVFDAIVDNRRVLAGLAVDRKRQDVLIGDVALAWCVELTGQDADDYGMKTAKSYLENTRKNPAAANSFERPFFESDEARRAAQAKWRKYVSAHPLPEMPAYEKVEIIAQQERQIANLASSTNTDNQNASLSSITLRSADREQVQRLMAGQQLCFDKRYVEGARELDRLLAAEEDFAFRPEESVPLYRCLKSEAESTLRAMPPEGIAAYRLQFEAIARRQLQEAIRTGGCEGIAAVADRFFLTETGAEAAYLAAARYIEKGDWFRAAQYLERLARTSSDAERFEPALSLRLAICWLQAGFRDEALAAVAAIFSRPRRVPLDVAGKKRDAFARPDEALRWIESICGTPDVASTGGSWSVYAGDAQRNRNVMIDPPYLRATFVAASVEAGPLRAHIKEHASQLRAKHLLALPTSSPLVVGTTIVTRSATHLQAFNFTTCRLLWEAGLEDKLRHYIGAYGSEAPALHSDAAGRAIRQRLWESRGFGTISSNGRLVFGVEDMPFNVGSVDPRMFVGPDGRRQMETVKSRAGNLLTAYEITTGKLKWEVGGPSIGGLPLAGTQFLGPPLPLGERLYVCARIGNETRLCELDAPTGNLLSHLTLVLDNPAADKDLARVRGMLRGSSVAGHDQIGPAYAAGTLVCQTADNEFVGINLGSRTVRWVCQSPEKELAPGQSVSTSRPESEKPVDRWLDNVIVIADGRVLLTPADSSHLICLSLADGRLQWTAPRQDGIYVGGVQGGRVVIAGRSDVRALNLSDGKPSWGEKSIPLPPDTLPSGRGLMDGDVYCLPLTSGEVYMLDVRRGRVAMRSTPVDGPIPGNLVAAHGVLFSQNAEGLCRFAGLNQREKELAAAIERQPSDAALLGEQGQVLLSLGRIDEAIDSLSKSLSLRPDEKTRQVLVDAIGSGLESDFARFRHRAEKLDAELRQARHQNHLIRIWARRSVEAGEFSAAFGIYLRMVDTQEEAGALLRVEDGHFARSDRWLAARLQETHRAAPADQRAGIDAIVSERLVGETANKMLPYLGWHTAANDTRLKLAAKLDAMQQPIVIERLLRDVCESGDVRQRGEALARLAQLAIECQRPLDAATYYLVLRDEFATQVCLNGKTGAELVAGLPADSPLREAIAGPPQWPSGSVKVESSEKLSSTLSLNLPILSSDPRLDSPLIWQCDSKSLTRCIDGSARKRWELPPKTDANLNQAQNARQFWHRGSLVVAWTGTHIYAFDATSSAARLLWKQENRSSPAARQQMMMRRAFRRAGTLQSTLPGAEPRQVAFTTGAICMLNADELLAYDPVDGHILWRRADVHDVATSFGDTDLLFVVDDGAEEARVYSILDGRLVGRRTVPKMGDCLWTVGRLIATWSGDEKQCELKVVDPWSQRTVWQKQFDGRAQPSLIDGDAVAVLDSSGKFGVFDLVTGCESITTHLQMPTLFERFLVQRSSTQYIAVAGSIAAGHSMGIFTDRTRLSGTLVAIDRRSCKLQWQMPIEKQGFSMTDPADLPLLVFYWGNIDLKSGQGTESLLCVDKRCGKTLAENVYHGKTHSVIQIEADLAKWQIDVRHSKGVKQLTFVPQEARTQ